MNRSSLHKLLKSTVRSKRRRCVTNTFITLIIIVISQYSVAQNVYDLSWKKGPKWVGAVTFGISIPVGKKIEPLNLDQIKNLDSLSIHKFDRISTTLYDIKAQSISDIILKGPIFALPFSTTFFNENANNENRNIPTIWLETNLLTWGLTTLTKNITKRTRPYAYNGRVSDDFKMDRNTRQSFFSGHTSMTTANSFLTARILADTNPDSNWIPFYWISAATIPAVMGYLRVKGGKHFPTDVIMGYVIGALAGILVPAIHK